MKDLIGDQKWVYNFDAREVNDVLLGRFAPVATIEVAPCLGA